MTEQFVKYGGNRKIIRYDIFFIINDFVLWITGKKVFLCYLSYF